MSLLEKSKYNMLCGIFKESKDEITKITKRNYQKWISRNEIKLMI